MTLYRADPTDGVAWVTGASTGIGRELSLILAGQGYTVAATARDVENLATLVQESQGKPGRVLAFPGDVRDEQEMAQLIAAIEAETGPIALAVFNAGAYFPTYGERLEVFNFTRTFAVNVFGTLNGLVPVVDRMRDRGFGHVVIVGSIASYFGWPATAAYGASKAALFNLAQSLKYDFDRLNIRIQVMNPGFVATPLTAKTGARLPAMMTAGEAASRIAVAMRKGGFETTFPRRFTWLTKLLAVLPHAWRHGYVRRATGWNKRSMLRARRQRAPTDAG